MSDKPDRHTDIPSICLFYLFIDLFRKTTLYAF